MLCPDELGSRLSLPISLPLSAVPCAPGSAPVCFRMTGLLLLLQCFHGTAAGHHALLLSPGLSPFAGYLLTPGVLRRPRRRGSVCSASRTHHIWGIVSFKSFPPGGLCPSCLLIPSPLSFFLPMSLMLRDWASLDVNYPINCRCLAFHKALFDSMLHP